MSKKLTVPAECHSDDRAVEVKFDAAPWLKKASTKMLISLKDCNFGGDYGADQVAIDMAGKNAEIAFMFKYIEARKRAGGDIGFEVHVQDNEAFEWLKANRPRVYKRLTTEGCW
jgi:hypothetical protein